ncbi:MAG TPA: cation diffusion facilitator family transporter [Gemmatimonadales bacterium]|nr:cation diffusion facilitator family transporter [Gemmatimonadales bacterium]
MPDSETQPRARTAAVRRVLVGILAANLVVVVIKVGVGLASGSLGVLGSALDSAIDSANNVLALIVTAVAAKAPDEEHPYGHGKFETLGALALVGFLCVSSFELLRGAVNHLSSGGHPLPVTRGQFGALSATLVVNAAVAWYERRRGRALESEILLADSSHTGADVFITLGVLMALILAQQGLWWADPVIAILVVGVILSIAYRVLVRTVPVLVDERVHPPERIAECARGIQGVCDTYDIRSRGGAHGRYAELTISVDGGATVAQAHQIADQVEARLKQQLDLHGVTVHVEPC